LLARAIAHRSYAGPSSPAIDHYRAGTAPSFAAAVFASGEVQVVSQDAEQTPFGVGVNAVVGSVHVKFGNSNHRRALTRYARRASRFSTFPSVSFRQACMNLFGLIGYRCCPLFVEDSNGWQTKERNSLAIGACGIPFRGVAPHA
jgi:hypothetical protein